MCTRSAAVDPVKAWRRVSRKRACGCEQDKAAQRYFTAGMGTGALRVCERLDSAINNFLDGGFKKLKGKQQVGFLRAVEIMDDVVFSSTAEAERWATHAPSRPFWSAEISHGDLEGSYTHTWNSFDERD